MKTFKERYKFEIRHLLQQKGGFDYLPWPIALRLAMEADPNFTYRYEERADGNLFFPVNFTSPESTGFVKVTAVMHGRSLTENLPVMNHRNKAIPNPTSKDINDALKRCLVKVIACHGLGLSAWSREFPNPEEQAPCHQITAVHVVHDPPDGWTWEEVTRHCQEKGWPLPANLSLERLEKMKGVFEELGNRASFDDLDEAELSGTP